MLNVKVDAMPRHNAERLGLSIRSFSNKSREALPRVILSAFCLLLSAFCILPSAFSATWTRQKSGTMAWLHSVYFLDQNRGWVAGSNGTLLKTTDSGATWNKVSTFTRDTLRDVYFADDNRGWLLAECDLLKLKTNDEARSYLLKTNDGGIMWQRVLVKTRSEERRVGKECR